MQLRADDLFGPMRLEGAALATERVERKLAAILAADIAGYSRLMGEDEEGTHERFTAHCRQLVDPKIREHRGRTVKNTGDGMLVEFPSVVGAVRCAVEIQRSMVDRNAETAEDKRIIFRIGVNLGDVIVEEDDIYGDGVNIAARLEALAEPGGICISRTVHDQIRDKLPYTFEEIGEQQLKNIARPMQVYRVSTQQDAGAVTGSASLPLPDKPSIAVLPFTNMSGDPEQEHFADGMVEDIITALSRYSSLFVIARNSCFAYKGRAVDVRLVGRELGVRYVLEGSLRKATNRIRVTAQLVEAETGKHVWAERYDRDLADIFALQDEITEAVTTAIAPVIADAERQRAARKPPGNLDAWAACQRGWWHMSKLSVEDNALAEKFFRRAIDLDPNFAGGYKGLVSVLADAVTVFFTRSVREVQSLSETLARQAIALDGADAEAHACLGATLWRRGDHEGARTEAERALAINPNLARGHAVLGTALIYSGRPKEGIAALETCIRLDPRDTGLAARLNQVAVALYFLGEYEAVIGAVKRAIRSYPDYPPFYRWLAAALGQLGRTDEAKEALGDAIALAPASLDLYVRQRVPWMRPDDHAQMLEGLRKAGWEG
jgi:adenylate cyclase